MYLLEDIPNVHTKASVGEDLEQWSPLIGIVTAIIGNILISFALNIQRYAHIRLDREQTEKSEQKIKRKEKRLHRNYGTQQGEVAEERLRLNLEADTQKNGEDQVQTPPKPGKRQSSSPSVRSENSVDSMLKSAEKGDGTVERKTYLRSPYWWAGIILMTVGEAGNFLAYGFAPASIVSPLGVVALVSNCIIAPYVLKERFRQRDFWGVAIAVAGTITIVLSANSQEKKISQDMILDAIERWEFLTYLGITVALMAVLMWASPKYGSRTILIDLGLVGLFGEYTALSTKGIASLLSDTLWRTLTFPITYVLILILVLTAVMQIRYVNRALQRFSSTQVIPTQYVIFTISVIIGSAVLYRDFESADAAQFSKFFGGCIMTFLGVYLITSQRTQGHGMGEDDGEYEADHEIDLRDEEQYQDEVPASTTQSKSSQPSGDNSVAVPSSRRSSHQPPISPHTPVRTPSHLSSPSPPSSPTLAQPYDPTLTNNPWRSSNDLPASSRPAPVPQPGTLDSSISSPLLPSEATRSNATLSTPTPPTPDRASPLLRRSVTRLGPSPLMSPLSPSFSAVVADQRRRSLRRPRLGRIRGSRASASQTIGQPDEEMGGPSPLKAVDTADGEQERGTSLGRADLLRRARSTSFGTAVGKFFSREGKGKDSEGRRQQGND